MKAGDISSRQRRRIFWTGLAAVLSVSIGLLIYNLIYKPVASEEVFRSIPINNFAIVPMENSVGLSANGAFRGALELRWDRKRFGGFSGLHVTRTGKHLTAISDHGAWFTGDPIFKAGILSGLRKTGFKRLIGADGEKLKKRERDAEALSTDGSGGFVVAFERQHRLLHYPAWRRPFFIRPRRIKGPPDLEALPSNHGLEAVTRLCDGGYLIIAQRSGSQSGSGAAPLMAWQGNDGAWVRQALQPRSDFEVSGATTLSDCSVAVIERGQQESGQWTTVISRYSADAFRSNSSEPRTGRPLLGPFSSAAKFEGIASHQLDQGNERILLIADNDYSGPTILLAFAIAMQ